MTMSVVKLGGSMLAEGAPVRRTARWLASVGREHAGLVVVHGGGDDVDRLLERLSIPTTRVRGQRVTSPEALPLVAGALAGTVNLRLVTALTELGIPALGLSGVSARAVVARLAGDPLGSLGRVGDPAGADAGFVRWVTDSGRVPVFASIASDGLGGYLNVNADLFASCLASALGARLLQVTDVPAILSADGKPFRRLTPDALRALLRSGTIHDGMVPKAEAAIRAVEEGVEAVWVGTLTDARHPSLSRGTWVVPERLSHPLPLVSAVPLPNGAGSG